MRSTFLSMTGTTVHARREMCHRGRPLKRPRPCLRPENIELPDPKRYDSRMALATTISLDKPLPEAQAAYVKAGQGKSLARESERIDTAARLAKVAAPTSML